MNFLGSCLISRWIILNKKLINLFYLFLRDGFDLCFDSPFNLSVCKKYRFSISHYILNKNVWLFDTTQQQNIALKCQTRYIKVTKNYNLSFWQMYSTTGDRSGFIFNCMKGLSPYLSCNKVISITWALGLAMAIPPLIGWSYYSPEPNGIRYIH